jgi:ABC-type amino acid transport system permease subunit
MNMIINYSAFGILTLLWLGFGAALILNQAILDGAWQFFRGMPLAAQLVVGFLVLPVVLGLWIWESSLPLWLRLILVLGLGFATIYTFLPKQA